MTNATPAAPRRHFLDWLRIAAFGLLVPYHTGMYYVRWPFHVKSEFASAALEPWMKLSEPWRLGLLFMVSGAVTALLLQRGATPGLLRERTRRLLLPLLAGMVLIVPPQAYFEAVQRFHYEGGYLDFLGLYFTGFRGFCEAGRCLILPTWNHLWFLPYLWLFTVGLWMVVRLWPASLARLTAGLSFVLRGPTLLLLPVALIWTIRWTLKARYPSTHALVGDVYNLVLYLSFFLLGTGSAPLWERMRAQRWPALGLALLAWALLVSRWGWRGIEVEHAIVACEAWCAVVAAFGFALHHADHDHPWRAWLAQGVLPFYILHQTLLIALTQALRPLHWTPPWEGPTLIVLTFALSALGYEALRRVGWLRPWFGLSPAR